MEVVRTADDDDIHLLDIICEFVAEAHFCDLFDIQSEGTFSRRQNACARVVDDVVADKSPS